MRILYGVVEEGMGFAGHGQDGNTTALRQISENLAYAAGSAIAARAKSRAPKAGRRATFG
jgi:hypothetical protein